MEPTIRNSRRTAGLERFRRSARRLSTVLATPRIRATRSADDASDPLSEHVSQIPPAHAGVVGRRVRLELFPTRERAGDHRIEAHVQRESGCSVERLAIIAGLRNADAVADPICLTLEHLEVHRVERLHPSRAWKESGGSTRRAFRMPGRVARHSSVTLFVEVPGVQDNYARKRGRKSTRKFGNGRELDREHDHISEGRGFRRRSSRRRLPEPLDERPQRLRMTRWCTSCPASSRNFAMVDPIIPAPTIPICIRVLLNPCPRFGKRASSQQRYPADYSTGACAVCRRLSFHGPGLAGFGSFRNPSGTRC